MPIKTLHITNYYHSSSGGVRIVYEALLAASNRRSRYVTLVVPGESDSVKSIGAYGKIYTIRSPKIPFFDSRYRAISPRAYLAGSKRKIWSLIREEAPDLIEICDKFSLPYIAGLMRKGWPGDLARPVLVGLSCERLDDNIRAYLRGEALWQGFARWYLGQIYIPQFDFHLANSEYTKTELALSLVPRHARQIAVCPAGVDCGLFTPLRRSEAYKAQLRQKLGIDPETVLLLYAGRIAPEKNIMLLPRVLRVLARDTGRQFVLLVAGSGPSEADFQEACRAVSPNGLRMLGQIQDRSELADLFSNCDVFLHPNPREPFGIAPLEAMAAGLPLVAPNSGGVLSYATEANSWLTMPNGEAFAWKVRNILGDSVARKQKTDQARLTAEANSWEIVTDRMFLLYDEILRAASVFPGPISGFAGTEDRDREDRLVLAHQ